MGTDKADEERARRERLARALRENLKRRKAPRPEAEPPVAVPRPEDA